MGKFKTAFSRSLAPTPSLPWMIMLALAVIFAALVCPRPVSIRYSYKVGDVAEKDIKAPVDFFIQDAQATEARQREAIESVQTVYDLDSERLAGLADQVSLAFARARKTTEADRQIRELEQALRLSGTDPNITIEPDGGPGGPARSHRDALAKDLGIAIDEKVYGVLVQEGFAEATAERIIRILTEILNNGVVNNKEILLREAERGIVLRDIVTRRERVVQDLRPFYGYDQAKTMVRIVGDPLLRDVEASLREVIVELAQRLIQPNITLNRSETAERRQMATEQVKPVLYQIKAGEMLLREGERVTPLHLLKLEASQPDTDLQHGLGNSFGAGAIVFCLLAALNVVGLKRSTSFERDPVRNLAFLAAVLLLFFALARITLALAAGLTQEPGQSLTTTAIFFGMPMASGAMLVCLFFGLDLALGIAIVLAVVVPLIVPHHFALMFFFMLNGAMGAYWVQDCRERRAFITAGVRLGLLNLFLVSAIALYTGAKADTGLLWSWALALMGGLGAGVVTAGLTPLVELAFGYTTDITLLELANLDRPILRQLMMEAPGTYHHSMIVGTMVEAAAAEIGANPLLAKVCGYYHDIGKVKKPLYFIENQRGGKNPHDKLAPSMSKRILVAHVKDGVEMARQHKLGQSIVDTIAQSHGTSLIAYFYERARQTQGETNINPDDYRYPGPRPQTREAGLVMLADVVEAASRSLENPTPSRIKGLVNNLINKIFSDGQLDDCELTFKDLNRISKTFDKILNGIHHHRIEYPERAEANGKGKNGRSDRQSPEPPADRDRKSEPSSPGHLKRPGLS